MTVAIAVVGALFGCAVATLLWIWFARRRPMSETDLRLEAVDHELAETDRAENEAHLAEASRSSTVAIPLQRTASTPRMPVTQTAQVGKPGSAA